MSGDAVGGRGETLSSGGARLAACLLGAGEAAPTRMHVHRRTRTRTHTPTAVCIIE